MQPWRRGWRSRRSGPALPACSRYPERAGPSHADPSLCRGGGRARRLTAIARAFAGTARPSPGDVGGIRMTTASLRSVYPGPGGFDPRVLRREFPIFANNPDLVFLDSGVSAQKPRAVIDRMTDYYCTDYANVHR